MPRHRLTVLFLAIALAAGGAGSACKKKNPPIARPTPPPPDDMTANRPPAPPEPVAEAPPVAVPPEPAVSSADMGSLDEINKKGILAPVFFEFDSAEMSSDGQAVLAKNAEMMKQYPTWIVSVEGHCDERGTAEYNLALGERRALSVRQYWSRSASPPSGSAPSATARSSPSIPATASRRGRATAAPTSSSPPSKGRQI
jgi:outer membrane protein OmpA-like peptidoglycan-associated protein